ncbi:RecX family transcriptional regulator [Paenibacillus oenotherae]|uniref:Regulatory protein RecX n=1 Tax=Paenibacillus oenotherae TaxID=1435645 RepID=A0ABS7D048_9BACL|nr:RecX family transcriptional regulator [Paenibacillus oenotherae]MBW7473223.1 RecX family transcriptional regulator [Paenibacillus oenotherae]
MTDTGAGREDEALLITAVEGHPKEKQRYLLYVNGSREPLTSVHEDLLIRYRLLKGREILIDELRQITEEDSDHRVYVLALSYLGARPRTSKEIIRYLARKGIEEAACEKALERLQQERLVDDDSYANRFASQRMRTQLKGRRLLRQELEQRGIAKTTAKEAADNLDREAEREAATRAAIKKWPHVKGESRDRKRKLMAFLLRRGFPSDVVKQALGAAIEAERLDEEGPALDN